ncbi:MAG TPA: valine--tRNA ligase, partial [Gammaproteobacteria bacterium]|nr:valine--tRNA ligase [Gammaproteobacteria bacterium]
DFNDYEVGQRHDLPLINVFTIDARIDDEAPEKYRSSDRFDARKAIVADLEALGLLEKIEDHKLMVPRGDRSGTVIEPFLTDQWYVKIAPLAEPAIAAVENGDIRFIPENWSKTYFEWMRNIQDWCISRQLWWGHRIPAWYDEEGNIHVGKDEADVRARYGLDDSVKLRQDEDVLDTWFSSALWPFSTLGWPEKTPELETFYPTSVLVTGFDIIFFWVARMIMFGLKFMGDVPFREVYVHGLIRDAEGQKMSKSKGNVLDPLDLIDGIDLESLVEKRASNMMQPEMAEKIRKATRKHFPDGIPAFGTDALRFTFAALASTGRDIRFDLNRIEGYRNFCNKLWNAARYVMMQCEGHDPAADPGQAEFSVADRWIRQELERTVQTVNEHFNKYRFDIAAKALYEFTWHEFCDWYLELSKPLLFSDDAAEAQKLGARLTLIETLETLLRLMHPVMPFITEEIWQQLKPLSGKTGDSIQLEAFPQAPDATPDEAVAADVEWLKTFIVGVRKIRSEMNVKPGKRIPVLLANWSDQDRQRYDRTRDYLHQLAKLESVDWIGESEAPEAAMALVGDLKVLIPLAGLIDRDAELARLGKEIDKLRGNLEKTEARLNNPSFAEKAPEQVVNQARQQAEEQRAALRELEQQLEKIRALG